MDFFQKLDSYNYFNSLRDKLKNEIDSLSDSEIMGCDFQEWATYYADKYYISPIILFDTNIEVSMNNTKVKRYNPFHDEPYERAYFLVDGVKITYKIPYDGDPVLFDIQPNRRYLKRFYTNDFVRPHGEKCGSFVLEFEYTTKELQDKGDTMQSFVKKEFDTEYGYYATMIGNVNDDANTYNDNLHKSALGFLEQRKKKADSFAGISKALQIPLTINKNAPNTKPIQLQRVTRKPASKPKLTPYVPEPYISDEDYTNINNIIYSCGTTMEKTARTYYHNTEEELRDHLLASLNTHYESATGETFRKIGKTDIHIEFENKAAFIGECKVWHGEKAFQSAVQQVLNYTTWRDLKVSIVVFNKNNQSFISVLEKMSEWISRNTVSHIQSKPNMWICRYHKPDANIDIKLTVLAFDLYIDKTQFSDVHAAK